jgi:hypothetical protein
MRIAEHGNTAKVLINRPISNRQGCCTSSQNSGAEGQLPFLVRDILDCSRLSADSITCAELAPCCNRALRLDDTVPRACRRFRHSAFHIDLFHFPLFRSLEARTLTTLHGRQDLSDLKLFYYRFDEMPLVSISAAQRNSLPHANFVATIPHGIPADLHRRSFERKVPCLPRPYFSGKAPRPCYKNCAACRHPSKDCRQGGQG